MLVPVSASWLVSSFRSVILENILAAFRAEGIPLAVPRVALAGNTAEN